MKPWTADTVIEDRRRALHDTPRAHEVDVNTDVILI